MPDPRPNPPAVDSEHANGEPILGDDAVDPIRAALRGLKFGVVSVIVQDGVVVQIERTEKRRLRRPGHN